MKSPIPEWSDAKFKGWIISLLRRGTMRWPPANKCLKAAKRGKKINTLTGRLAEHYECAHCGQLFPLKQVCKDHINPIVDPITGFIDWNIYIARMFCSLNQWQILCKNCHTIKTVKEKEIKRNARVSRVSK